MPVYTYKAKDRDGNTVSGSLDAVDERAAAASIRENGQLPMDIRQMHAAPVVQSREAGSVFARYLIYPLWTGVNLRALAIFFRQLATMLAAGMSLSEALRSIGSRTHGKLGKIIAEALGKVEGGERLSDTLSRYPSVFSRLQISLVRAGEAGGLMESMLSKIADYLEYELSIRRKIAMAMLYPMIALVMALLIYVGVIDNRISLLVNGNMAGYFKIVLPPIWHTLLALIAVIIALKLLFRFTTVRLAWDTVKIVPPVVGTCARKIAMSRFSRAMAALYAAGMNASESVAIASDACANLALGRSIMRAVPAIQSGEGFTASLGKTGAVMPLVLDMMATGEKSGNTDAALKKAAEYMENEVDATVTKLGIALFVIGIIVAGVVVGVIVVQFYGGMLGNELKQGGA